MSAQTTPILDDPPRSCGSCIYWRAGNIDAKHGACFFNPPAAMPAQGEAGLDGRATIGVLQIRSPTHSNEICHEHTFSGEMHSSEALVAAVADLIAPIQEIRDHLRHLVDTIGTGKAT